MNSWMFLLLAATCEMIWPIGAKYTHGFKDNYPVMTLTFAMLILSFWLMSRSIDPDKPDHIAVGTAYAVWTAIGTAGTAVLGMILFNEARDVWRIVCLVMIISGVIGLKFLAPLEKKAGDPLTTNSLQPPQT